MMPDHPEGRPIEIDFVHNGNTIGYRMVCPMCGSLNFILSHDYELGGCANPDCPCVCFERLRDYVDPGGVGWAI